MNKSQSILIWAIGILVTIAVAFCVGISRSVQLLRSDVNSFNEMFEQKIDALSDKFAEADKRIVAIESNRFTTKDGMALVREQMTMTQSSTLEDWLDTIGEV